MIILPLENPMKSGYKIFWTDYVIDELEKTIEYLNIRFFQARQMISPISTI